MKVIECVSEQVHLCSTPTRDRRCGMVALARPCTPSALTGQRTLPAPTEGSSGAGALAHPNHRLVDGCTHMSTHAHTYTYIYTCTYTYTHAHTRTHAYMHTHTCSLSHTVCPQHLRHASRRVRRHLWQAQCRGRARDAALPGLDQQPVPHQVLG